MAAKKRKQPRPRSTPSFASRYPPPSTAEAFVYAEYDITDARRFTDRMQTYGIAEAWDRDREAALQERAVT
jgi:hypothetical protein